MTYETLLVEHRGRASFVTFNRPPLNLFTERLLRELLVALKELGARSETRVVVIGGVGQRAFSAGGDMNDGPYTAERGRAMTDLGRAIVETIEILPKPVVSAVRGWCIGGGTGVAWVADIRIAAESAKFRASDAYLGIMPTWGVSLGRLVHFIGRNRALDLLLLGEDVNARQAYELGLVTRVIPDADFDAEVDRVAARLAEGAPLVFQAMKESARAQYRETPDAVAALEARWAERNEGSHDSVEGVRAFQEKRKPNFRGA